MKEEAAAPLCEEEGRPRRQIKMKKIGKITLGGIQQKVFNLVLIMIILIMAVYSAVILYQMNSMSRLVDDTNKQQKEAVTAISGRTMDAVIDGSLTRSTRMQARIADDMFADTADVVKVKKGL